MTKIKNIVSILLALTVLIFCCSCTLSPYEKVNDVTKYESIKSKGLFSLETAVVAENNEYKLLWDDNAKNVLLENKKSGKIWSTSPVGTNGTTVEDTANVFSPVNLTYIIRSAFSTQDITGKAGAVNAGNVTCKKIDGGIEVTLLFEEVSISVPVCFVLNDNGLKVYVELEKIGENADATGFRAYSLQLAPYLCAVENSAENYLFVPSGSGALMYTDARGDGAAREFKSAVYGADASSLGQESYTNEQAVRMPVFSANSGTETLCAVIDEGAEMSSICANAGDSASGFSNAFAEFKIRGLSVSMQEYGGNSGKSTYNYYSYDRISDGNISVTYTPLSDEKEGYMRTAEYYKKSLISEYSLDKKSNDSVLNIKLIGGIQVKQRIFGIPYNTVYPLTTFDEAAQILKSIKDNTGVSPNNVQLLGYGESGLQSGKLAGGFKYSKKTGNKKSLNLLKDYCEAENTSLYYDFDVLFFNSSGNGFSASSDNSLTANNFPVEVYRFSPATSDILDEYKTSSILKRNLLLKAVEKTAKATNKMQLKAVSLSTFSNTVYSDFSDGKYTNCRYMADDYENAVKILRNSGIESASSNANIYAAALSKAVFDTPTYSAKYTALDTDIPFYQMICKGLIPFSLESVNTSNDPEKQILKTIETGAAFQFSLISEYSAQNAGYLNPDLQDMKYNEKTQKLLKNTKKAYDLISSVSGEEIADYKIMGDNIRKTVFSNGVTVYVNYGETPETVDSVLIEANSYTVVK